MEASERDTANDWQIKPSKAPATVHELEGRIDVALATARTAEEAALEIGAASLEAAEQARRAAALAERASVAAMRAAGEVAAAPRLVAARAAEPEPATEPPAAERPAAVAEAGEAPSEEMSAEPESAQPTEAPPMKIAPAPVVVRDRAATPRRPDPFDERLTAFRERAENVMIRLQKLESGAVPGDGPSEVVRLR
jgi:hypothetical protein